MPVASLIRVGWNLLENLISNTNNTCSTKFAGQRHDTKVVEGRIVGRRVRRCLDINMVGSYLRSKY